MEKKGYNGAMRPKNRLFFLLLLLLHMTWAAAVLTAQAAVGGFSFSVREAGSGEGELLLDQGALYDERQEPKDFFWVLMETREAASGEGAAGQSAWAMVPLSRRRISRILFLGEYGTPRRGFTPVRIYWADEGSSSSFFEGALLSTGTLWGIRRDTEELMRFNLAFNGVREIRFLSESP